MPKPVDPPAVIFLAHEDDVSFVERLTAALKSLRPDLDPKLRNVGLRPFRAREDINVVFMSQSLQRSGYLNELTMSTGRLLFANREKTTPSGLPSGHLIIDLSRWDGGGHESGLLQLAHSIDALASDVYRDQFELGSYNGLTEAMLLKVERMPFQPRTQRLLRQQNIIFVGDLITRTGAEMLRIPDFGRKSFQDVNKVLNEAGLRLGMDLPEWPPINMEMASMQITAARRAADLQQADGGAVFDANDEVLIMAVGGVADDRAAANQRMTQQMHAAILEKARSFAGLAERLDNQVGWTGIGRCTRHLAELLDRPSESIPEILGYLYPTALELGSFIEMDDALMAKADGNASTLEPEVRRPLNDLVRNLAPWLRSFPSAREADDAASRFLIKAAELRPTIDVVQTAADVNLLSDEDVEVFRQLSAAAERGEFQGDKAAGRAKRSASNMVIKSIQVVAGFYLGAISSDFALHSVIVQRAGLFLASAEIPILHLIADIPQDLRFAITEFMRNAPLLSRVISDRTR